MEQQQPKAIVHTLEDGRQVTTRVYLPGKVAVVEGVVTEEECKQIIELGKQQGFNCNDDENALGTCSHH